MAAKICHHPIAQLDFVRTNAFGEDRIRKVLASAGTRPETVPLKRRSLAFTHV